MADLQPRLSSYRGKQNVNAIRLEADIAKVGEFRQTTSYAQSRSLQATVQTTDGTVTTVLTIATENDTQVSVFAQVDGRQTNASAGASYLRHAGFRNNAGTLTQIGATTDISTVEDVAGWDAEIVVSGTNIIIRITGAAGDTVEWGVTAHTNEILI